MGGVEPLSLFPADISDTASIAHALVGADQAVNLVGILFEARKQRFQSVHTDAAASITDASQTAGLRQLVHHVTLHWCGYEIGFSLCANQGLG